MARNLAPSISSGGNWSSRAPIFAPISASGRMMRRMGRRESDSSPPILVRNGCAARIPDSIRIVEPEFPASRSPAARRGPSSPFPRIATSVPAPSTSIPSALTHPSVDWQSAPVE